MPNREVFGKKQSNQQNQRMNATEKRNVAIPGTIIKLDRKRNACAHSTIMLIGLDNMKNACVRLGERPTSLC